MLMQNCLQIGEKNTMRIIEANENFCSICFCNIKNNNLYAFIHKDICLCDKCMTKISAKFKYFNVNGYKGMSLFDYDSEIRQLIYLFKGCFDIVLAKVFLERYSKELSLMYRGYVMVPAPSYIDEDKTRQFNHVEEIFSLLKLKMCKCIIKTTAFKQATHNSNDRTEISKCLELVGGEELKGKKVLLVDDVYTTGSTMKTMISLVETLKPKEIRILVISKTILKPLDT